MVKLLRDRNHTHLYALVKCRKQCILSYKFNRPLKNYLRCRRGVKNRLKILIY